VGVVVAPTVVRLGEDGLEVGWGKASLVEVVVVVEYRRLSRLRE